MSHSLMCTDSSQQPRRHDEAEWMKGCREMRAATLPDRGSGAARCGAGAEALAQSYNG